ncbi:FAD:protein FMN transferase [Dermacoccus sp. PAMC28757]|uniref:FAD:protein FMN transferase n=1 Tax=Dermacoccus sp. PAMC28757 TaxID=2762331 RepID=UPI00164DE919|nr:FAD:protein FMN transferase [Dermacoccus sp. PAMC28757]QNK52905.1 FAD:protein FMN transferase [Dermacoccus sp. PAMC28757]
MTTTLSAPAAARTEFFEFDAIGCHHRVVVLGECDLARVERLTQARIEQLDLAVSRFRADSELSRLNARSDKAARRGEDVVTAPISLTFLAAMRAALRTASLTDGLVVPHLGRQIEVAGYDVDLDLVRRRGDLARRERVTPHLLPLPTICSAERSVTLAAGSHLDLGGSAKAWCAQILAEEIALEFGVGVLVSLGGDIATSGPIPGRGWEIDVRDASARILQRIRVREAVATSSTRLRRWVSAGEERHHIIDPRTGRSATPIWAQVSAAAPDTVQANAATTAAVILGKDAPAWLEGHGVPALLQGADGQIVTTSGWQAPA